jgi:hypothetical protein
VVEMLSLAGNGNLGEDPIVVHSLTV